ncbi:MAG: hypothetical protein IPK18_01665 [Sphingobacteriales bacterium]|nr:MAG: hypothetical protein IPK18_01665 [Sphingobacteriales bacterium]
MTIRFFILIIVLFGFSIKPTQACSCETKSTKAEVSCCENEKSDKDSKNSCCNNKTKNDKDKNTCNGKCNNTNCNCPTSNFAFVIGYSTEIENKSYSTATSNTKTIYTENYLSDGYNYIWQPPKIG